MVDGNTPIVNWNNQASQGLRKISNYILQESYSNAEKVRSGIVKVVDQLPDHPKKYPLDNTKKIIPVLPGL